jgi:hypothetical protein
MEQEFCYTYSPTCVRRNSLDQQLLKDDLPEARKDCQPALFVAGTCIVKHIKER